MGDGMGLTPPPPPLNSMDTVLEQSPQCMVDPGCVASGDHPLGVLTLTGTGSCIVRKLVPWCSPARLLKWLWLNASPLLAQDRHPRFIRRPVTPADFSTNGGLWRPPTDQHQGSPHPVVVPRGPDKL